MHASIILAALAFMPLSLAAPAPPSRLPSPQPCPSHSPFPQPPSGPPSPPPRPVSGRQNESVARPVAGTRFCDLSKVAQPKSTLAQPSASMRLVLIALGKGTQNYTCASATSAPAPIGALATLYDASCALASNPRTATKDLPASQAIGQHFFVDNTTPDFNVAPLGNTELKKVEDAVAPSSKDVKWLRLQTQAAGTTSQVKTIYRLSTVGGVAPATCAGKSPGQVITVVYEAQYWFYA